MSESYKLPSPDFSNEKSRLKISGDLNSSYFVASYQIPGIEYAFKPVYLQFLRDSYSGGTHRTNIFVRSEAMGGNQFDPSPLINREASVDEALFIISLLEVAIPDQAEIIRESGGEYLKKLMQITESRVVKSFEAVNAAKHALEEAMDKLQKAIQTNEDTNDKALKALRKYRRS